MLNSIDKGVSIPIWSDYLSATKQDVVDLIKFLFQYGLIIYIVSGKI